MTFRGRLTLFFTAIVLAPLGAGAVVVHALAERQSVREAESRLERREIAALRVEDRLAERVRFRTTRSLAIRASRASPAELERLRSSADLGFLIVGDGRRVVGEAVGVPRFPQDTAPSGEEILEDAAGLPVVQRRIELTGRWDEVVVGGNYLDRAFLERVGGPAMVVGSGQVVVSNLSDEPSTVPAARFFELPHGLRGLCVCVGTPPSGIVLVTAARSVGFLPSLPGPVVALLVIGTILAGLLAFELARVLSKPHERALDRLVVTEHLSVTDALTGLPNRRELERVLSEEAKRAARFEHPLSVLMVDVDRFKSINDQHGHVVGDRVLAEVARRIEESLRGEIDTVARYGGEEFTVVLPETEREGAVVVAEKLRAAVAAAPFPDGFTVTVSVGVSCRPGDGTTPEELVRAADAALYEAKRGGRDRVVAAVR